jgi:hypothetical protein
MLVRPDHLLKLIEGMEARISKGFRVCPETAPLMVEALRLYARMHAIEPANFRVEKWDWRNQHVEEVREHELTYRWSCGIRGSSRAILWLAAHLGAR